VVENFPVQSPIAVDTKWLLVGHVDEIFGFLGGNKVVVASPTKAYSILTSLADPDGAVLFSTGG